MEEKGGMQEKGRTKTTENEENRPKQGENGGKWRNDRKKVGKKRRKIVENTEKREENGGMPGKR